jgi:dihydroxyacetone kinase-like protein
VKKLINNPSFFVEETLEGILAAHPGMLRCLDEDSRAIVRKDTPTPGKVAIATGGGSGHLPLFLGYVGKGLADGVAVGNVFSSPSADTMLNVTKAINGGAGVLYLYGHYFGDSMNFDMAADLASFEGIDVETVRFSDDIASAPRQEWQRRRGVAGIFFAYKAAGAKAEQLASLTEVKRIAEKVVLRTATMGVALAPCTLPAVGKPIFNLGEQEMELGMGIHGEPGVERVQLKSADLVAEDIVPKIVADLSLQSRDEVAVLVNGLGATPLEELYILFRRVNQLLQDFQIKVSRVYVGEYATSLEMAGASISLLHLDEELKLLLDEPARTPFFCW